MFALSLAATRVALCLPLAAACGRDAPARQVALDPVAPRRIVSLGPSGTEILASLGMVDRMVGRSKWDLWPDTVRFIPELGDAIRPSVELIVAARPDLVVLYRAADNVAAAEALEGAGIRVVSLRIDTIEEFFGGVDSLGRIVGAGSRADSITRALREELRDVRERLRPGAPVRVFVPVWEEPLMTVGAGSFLSELVGIAGGRNVYDDETAPSLTVSLEDVIRRDPDLVLAGPNMVARIRSEPRWQALRAVRQRHVVAFDTTLVSQPSTRLGQAARSIERLLQLATR